jgi:DNA-binding NarL/FixJ family response regulator
MQAYIRYQEAERLLQIYPDLKVMSENIRRQIKGISEKGDNKDDNIASLALHHASFDDIPIYSTGAITDKTCSTAIKYREAIDNEHMEVLQELMTELILLENAIDKIGIGMTILLKIQKDIIAAKYWQGLTWTEIASNLLMTESTCKQRRKEAIERLCIVSKITLTEFEQVVKLFS